MGALRAHASQTEHLIALIGAETYRVWWQTESFIDAHTHGHLSRDELIGATR